MQFQSRRSETKCCGYAACFTPRRLAKASLYLCLAWYALTTILGFCSGNSRRWHAKLAASEGLSWSEKSGPSCDCPPRVYTAPHNHRKYMATVLSLGLDGISHGLDKSRLPKFMDAWARAWPGLSIHHQPTFMNHPDLMGYGVMAGYYFAVSQALIYLHTHAATCDFLLIFEDDAMPFNGTTWPACGKKNDLDTKLDDLEAVGGTALVLGGHHFKEIDRLDAAAAASKPNGGITSASSAYGAYGFIMKCTTLESVAAHLHAHLQRTHGKTLCFEDLLWSAFSRSALGEGSGVHVSAPLLVDHAHGYSATWNRTVTRPFEGNLMFW